MQYKVGDEVLIKAEITDVSDCSERPYFVAPDCRSINWVSEDKIIPMGKTYVDGLNDAWELAKKILYMKLDVAVEVFDCTRLLDVMDKFNPQEALAKIEAYEKEKEIKVGDVVTRNANGFNGIVTSIKNGEAHVMYDDGSTTVWSAKNLTKTGKHIDIEGLLRQIGE